MKTVLMLALVLIQADPAAAQADTLTLVAAVRAALATHPAVALRVAEQDRASASVREARSARLPRVVTDWNAVRHQEPMIVAPLHAFDPRLPPDFDRTLLQGNLGASWLLYDGGARGARVSRAESVAAAAGGSVRSAEAALIARVARVYLDVAEVRDRVSASLAQVAALEAERTRVLRFEAEGRAAPVAVLRAEAALSRARAELATREARLGERIAELVRLTGRNAERTQPLVALVAAPASLPDRSVLLARAVSANPDVLRARRQLEGAEAARREAGAAFHPTVSLVARYNAYGSAGDEPVLEWLGAVQLSWPVFTGGLRSGAVQRAEAEIDVARHALRLAELEAESAIDRALAAHAEAVARGEALGAAVTQYEAVVAVERLALDAGAGVQTDFLAAQSALLDARADRSAAGVAAVLAVIEIVRATGELTADWLDSNLAGSR